MFSTIRDALRIMYKESKGDLYASDDGRYYLYDDQTEEKTELLDGTLIHIFKTDTHTKFEVIQ
jgi:hypothetical protein